MKNVVLALLLLTVTSIRTQENTAKKELTLEQSVLSYYNGLYPKTLSGLSWTANNLISYRKDSILVVQSPKASRAKTKTSKAAISTIYQKSSALPYFSSISSNNLYFFSSNSYVNVNLGSSSFTEIFFPKSAQNLEVSNDHTKIAYTINNNLYYSSSTVDSVPVTTSANPDVISGQAIHRFEFGISKGIFWSPNSSSMAFYQKDESEVANYPLLNINSTPGALNSIKYPMAGQSSEKPQIGVYNTITRNLINLAIGENYADNYLTNLCWGPNSKYIYVAQLNRDQNHMQLVKYDANSGEKIAVLFEEKNSKWVEPEHPPFFMNGKADEFLWLSEKDGFMNIYHYKTNGKLIKQLTTNKWVTTEILGYNESTQSVIYSGTGEDPRNLHCFSVQLNDGITKQLTSGDGIHRCKLSLNGKYLIDIHATINNGPTVNVIETTKTKSKILHQADNPLDNFKTAQTELISVKANDSTTLYGRLILPSEMDENKKYPVLVYVYGGPHAQMVTNGYLAGASLWMHWMAEQGYLVFTIDNRGSSNRGFDFESCIHRQLGKVEIEDQITGINYLKSHPFVDTTRFSVHGWSFGGFMTSSMLLKVPEVFNCGVAGGPVTDWKWYEVMYGERYMDTPNQNNQGYEESSVLNHTQNLKGKLLLIHGTSDDVVVMQHNLALVQKFVSEGTQVDFFPYPMHPHNVRGKDRVHLMTKVLNYILEHNK
uniref:Dipeptidylpeptidase IV, S9B family n=1 Tax=uncultured Flavobacteriia bacterium TaxID=212695 RepID=F4MN46_9BACT|nr:peptidase, S9 family [uncultured bacterium]CBL87559.1 dipeptidylpeptidase IV, S9B family [uncultured Flavobacteriia bacterium]